MTWTLRVLYAGLSWDIQAELAAISYPGNLTTTVSLEVTRIPAGYLKTMKFPVATLGADCRLVSVIGGGAGVYRWRFHLNLDGTPTSAMALYTEGGGGGAMTMQVNTSKQLVVTRGGGTLTSTTVINTATTSFDTFDVVLDTIRGLLWMYDKTAAAWLGPVSASTAFLPAGTYGELLGGGIGRGANFYALLAEMSSTVGTDAPDETALPDIAYVGQFPLADATLSGSADPAVTTTSTTLRDTRLASPTPLTTDQWIEGNISCGGSTLTIGSNNGDTFTGTWDVQPASGLAWSFVPPYSEDQWTATGGSGAKASRWDDGRGAEADGNDGDTTYLASAASALQQQASTTELRATVGGIGASDPIIGAGVRVVSRRGVTGKVATAKASLVSAIYNGVNIVEVDPVPNAATYGAGAAFAAYSAVGSALDLAALAATTGSNNDFIMAITLLHGQWVYYAATLALAPGGQPILRRSDHVPFMALGNSILRRRY